MSIGWGDIQKEMDNANYIPPENDGSCPDCGSIATTCWDCKDKAIEELETALAKAKELLEECLICVNPEEGNWQDRLYNAVTEFLAGAAASPVTSPPDASPAAADSRHGSRSVDPPGSDRT